jgi:hypothetical protein
MHAYRDAGAPRARITELTEEHEVLYQEVGYYFSATSSGFAAT